MQAAKAAKRTFKRNMNSPSYLSALCPLRLMKSYYGFGPILGATITGGSIGNMLLPEFGTSDGTTGSDAGAVSHDREKFSDSCGACGSGCGTISWRPCTGGLLLSVG